MRRKIRWSWVVALMLSLTVAAPPSSGQDKRFQDTTDVVVVEVPIQVVRSTGEPVRGLTAGDFEILDGRKSLPIIGFEEIDLSMTEGLDAEVTDVPLAGRRHFLLLFDTAFSRPTSIVKARDAARELVQTALHPTDLVSVGTYNLAGGARMLVGFTTDRDQTLYAIDTLGIATPNESVRDPLGLVLSDVRNFDIDQTGRNNPGGGSPAAGGRPNAAIEIQELLENVERSNTKAQRQNEIMTFSASLMDMAMAIKGVTGRKHVVFLSEGFDSSALLGLGSSSAEEQRRSQQLSEAAAAGRIWEVSEDDRFGSASTQSRMDDMLDAFKRADCAIHSVDIAGLQAGGDVRPRTRNEDGLFVMADGTGGTFVRNFNDPAEAMSEVLERTSVTYLLAVQPEKVKLDGAYHKLNVKVALDERGLEILHKPGYYAPKPYSELDPVERQLSTAGLILGGLEEDAIFTSVLATPLPVLEGRSWVPVMIEVDGAGLLEGGTSKAVVAEIFAYAIDERGSVRDFFSQTMAMDRKKVAKKLGDTGFKFIGHFRLPPGEYSVRTLVRNADTGKIGLRVAELTVQDNDSLGLLPALFVEPEGKWLLTQAKPREGEAEVSYPFVLGDKAYVPAARVELRNDTPADLCLMASNLSEGPLNVRALLFDAAGEVVNAGALQISGRSRIGDLDQLEGSFNPGSAPPGEYELRVMVRDEEADSQVISAMPISIVG
jgi:VWFA-related protein